MSKICQFFDSFRCTILTRSLTIVHSSNSFYSIVSPLSPTHPRLLTLCVPFPISFTFSVSPQPPHTCLTSLSHRLPLTPPFLLSVVSLLSHRCLLTYVTSHPFYFISVPSLLPFNAWLSLYLFSLSLLSVFPLIFQPSHLYLHFPLKVFSVSKSTSYSTSVSFPLLPISSLRLPLLPHSSFLCFPLSIPLSFFCHFPSLLKTVCLTASGQERLSL
jgi:hypothetical protein